MVKEKYYTPKEACEILGIHIRTFQKWDNIGRINVLRTPSNRRKISQTELDRILKLDTTTDKEDLSAAIYARVSSHDQKKKGDLERQVGAILMKVDISKYSGVETITDVGSGLNDKRKGLMRLMSLAKEKKISTIYINYKDRLTRFGFNYLETYFNSYGVTIIVVSDEEGDKTSQDELFDDMMSVIASFSGKLYGLRSGKNKVVESEIKNIVERNL